MGRGRVQLKRIENRVNRHVTFSKRRSGLLKKAYEISVLCDVDVALIIFSGKGKLYEYSTDSSMKRILERYELHFYDQQEMRAADPPTQENLVFEHNKLRSRVESILKIQRQLSGEDLEQLSTKELQHLELQVENGLKQIKSRKNQLIFDSILELREKEKELQEQNNALKKMVKAEEMQKEEKKVLIPHAHQEQMNKPTYNSSSSPNFDFRESLLTLNFGI